MIHGIAIAFFLIVVIGSLIVKLAMRQKERKRRRTARGFRSMRSAAKHEPGRTRKSNWHKDQGSRRDR